MSITQLAKELKVSRARVYQIIDSLDDNEKPKKKGDRYVLDEEAVKAIRNYFINTSNKSNDARQDKKDSQDNSQVLRILESQLNEKDKQIEKLQKLVDQSQQLQLQTQKQLETANEKVKQLEQPLKNDSEGVQTDSDINVSEENKRPTDEQPAGQWWKFWK